MRRPAHPPSGKTRILTRFGTFTGGRAGFLALAGALAATPRPASPQEAAASHRETGPLPQATCPDPARVTDGTTPHVLAVVRYLAADALAGRLAGSPGARCAAEYIAAQFQRIGLEPVDGRFFQPVPLASLLAPHAPAGTGHNVIAILRGSDPALRDEAVVIGAHFDHLGLGGFGSLAPNRTGVVHNGADDNASGVGVMLAAAERLAADPPARSILFIAFTGEEYGLLGSGRYVAEPAVPLDRTRAMLNLDMVGRLEEGPLIVYGTGTAAEWPEILDVAGARAGVPLAYQEEGYGPSDHTSFYARDVPVLHFFTNVHEDYHRPSDDWRKIDAPGMERVAALVAGVAREVANRRAPLALVRGAGTPPRPGGGGYGPYLGTVPDFATVERGVRLSGVRKDSPADRAGMRTGDVLVGFGGAEIADLYDFTDALRAHAPGDTVHITVLRDGVEVSMTAVLGSREGGR